MSSEALDFIRVFAPVMQGIGDGASVSLVFLALAMIALLITAWQTRAAFSGSASRRSAIYAAEQHANAEKGRQPHEEPAG